jgi:3-methylfumaryl-CoA hydratase
VDLAHLQTWIGRTQREREQIAAPLVRRLAATLDEDAGSFQDGAALPEGWHVALFGTDAPSHTLGPDGHPPRGDFLPPAPLPRRMFAGRRLTFVRPLVVGAVVTRASTITGVAAKEGRTGPLVFVTARYEFADAAGTAIIEDQDVVYRAAAGAVPAPTAEAQEAQEAPTPPDWSEAARFDMATLFRFSAVTFNAHRIHYDRDYARDVEAYPDLVVNAGLTTLRMLAAAKRRSGRAIAHADIRHVAPIFLSQAVALEGRGASVRALQGGRACVEARIRFAS